MYIPSLSSVEWIRDEYPKYRDERRRAGGWMKKKFVIFMGLGLIEIQQHIW